MRWDLDALRQQIPADREEQPAVPPLESVDRPQRPAVIVAIVASPEGVLLGRRNDGRPPWTFIAGENEPGESPADTIVREVKEETGLAIKPGTEIAARVHPRTGRHMVYVAARMATRERTPIVGDPEELAEVRWVTLAEAEQLMQAGGGMHEPVRAYLARTLSSTARGRRTPAA
jgi:8-oxo-dGTP diphosphatase